MITVFDNNLLAKYIQIGEVLVGYKLKKPKNNLECTDGVLNDNKVTDLQKPSHTVSM